jgi:sugar transferase (PEP-CTERM/EpsH1 system associated)
MAKILLLVHRLPYPPNKGDKVRSYHLLRHLAAKHEVHLGTFVDDPDDAMYVAAVRRLCAAVHVVRLDPKLRLWRAIAGVVRREPLSLAYYTESSLRRWVADAAAGRSFDAVIVFSSAMAQFVPPGLPFLLDFVDVDSAKWARYGAERRWPLSWIYRLEGRRLLAYERAVARRARASFFVTEKEVALFESLAPECRGLASALGNGVDSDYFSPDVNRRSPFSEGEIPIVFTGAMDYWPNVDAARWFTQDVLPHLRREWPTLRFHVVGRSPTSDVRALSSQGVNVTGGVPDVRPYLQHAAVVVAPLRLARGIQNKILEAMAMARPVVAAASCVEAMYAEAGRDLLVASRAEDWLEAIGRVLGDPACASALGAAARRCVTRRYSWEENLSVLDRHLEQVGVNESASIGSRAVEPNAGALAEASTR